MATVSAAPAARRLDERAQVALLTLAALVVRVGCVLFLAAPTDLHGGDAWWYLQNGADLVRAAEAGPLPTGPGYLLFVGVIGLLFPGPATLPAIQLAQAALGALTVTGVYLLGRRIWSHRVGMVAGAVLAVSPAFVIESAQIATETLFIFLLVAALAGYVSSAAPRARPPLARDLAGVGVLFGLAALTRAALLAFPPLLATHGWRRAAGNRRQGLRLAGAMLLAFALTLAPWTVYNLARWDRFVVAAEGFASFLWLGAQEEGWQGPQATDAALGLTPDAPDAGRDFGGQAMETIRADPLGYAGLRLRNLAEAVAQPHNTVYFGGESLKSAAARWLADDRSLSGLLALSAMESFWPKLALYLFHYAGVIGGLAGMAVHRFAWTEGRSRSGWAFALYALIGYYLAVHVVLYVITRYLFPLEAAWWLFAAFALCSAWERLAIRRRERLLREP